jgi:hypothetical protein
MHHRFLLEDLALMCIWMLDIVVQKQLSSSRRSLVPSLIMHHYGLQTSSGPIDPDEHPGE